MSLKSLALLICSTEGNFERIWVHNAKSLFWGDNTACFGLFGSNTVGKGSKIKLFLGERTATVAKQTNKSTTSAAVAISSAASKEGKKKFQR